MPHFSVHRLLSRLLRCSFARYSNSSKVWLERQRRDPFVRNARVSSYRCRSAFKLLQINDLVPGGLINPGDIVLDCGAAPGSWTQVAVKLSCAHIASVQTSCHGFVISLDLQDFEPVEGTICLPKIDIRQTEDTAKLVLQHINSCPLNTHSNFPNGVDLVLSDIAPQASGINNLDHPILIELAACVLKVALHVSRPGADLLIKLWSCPEVLEFVKVLELFYKGSWDTPRSKTLTQNLHKSPKSSVRLLKPPASRIDSAEIYLFARGFSLDALQKNY